jgi:hypothetical protein
MYRNCLVLTKRKTVSRIKRKDLKTMHDASIIPVPKEVLAHLEKLLAEGLRHGFFEVSIRCEVKSHRRRELIITAGKSHKFYISEDDVPR